mmetsp:Transcript_14984/g.26246  ORF Transcript_14984/g.26246 Transcript_14984/m.26246 type:complete len:301 (-) Transcript_14984:149-1051(-)
MPQSAPHSAREPRRALQLSGHEQVAYGTVPALGFQNRPQNLLLVRDAVGKAKPTCFDLPEATFSYGRPGNTDLEGAREVSMRWVSHTPSKGQEEDEPDFMAVNRRAAQAKITNAKDLREYRKETEVRGGGGSLSARGHMTGMAKPIIPSDVIPGFSYGRKVRPSTPIHEVISARFAETSERQLDRFYAEMRDVREASRTQVRKIPLTAATRARAASVKKALAQHEDDSKEPFKLTKFKRVGPKVQSYRQKSAATQALEMDVEAAQEDIGTRMQSETATPTPAAGIAQTALAQDLGDYNFE